MQSFQNMYVVFNLFVFIHEVRITFCVTLTIDVTFDRMLGFDLDATSQNTKATCVVDAIIT